MRFLVTGSSGFIGSYLCRRLLEDNSNRVVGIDNMNDYYDVSLKEDRLKKLKENPNFTFYKVDIADKEEVFKIFEKENFDIVINLAAQAGVRYSIDHPDCYINSNVLGFYNILEACRRYPVKKLLFASSSSVYGNNKKTPYKTTDMVDTPVSLYAATKKSNELMAYAYSNLYNIPVVGLRFFTVYGPMGRPDMAYYLFTKRIMEDKPIKVFNKGDMYRDFTYVEDIVDGITALIPIDIPADENNIKYKIYNIGNNHPVKISEFIKILEKLIGKEAKKEFLPMQDGDVYKTFADIDELTKDTGFSPKTSIEEGLEEFVKWYKEYYK
ncbi:MAG: GDP-mannose 4,6-dehydratase [Bacilli bacterium]|nr:GDP-mannose 4,6-dehydratase [Bacilli bacterium]